MKFVTKIFAIFCMFSLAHAQDVQDDFQRFSLVPVLGYTEETKLQYGAMFLLFLRPNEGGDKVHEI